MRLQSSLLPLALVSLMSGVAVAQGQNVSVSVSKTKLISPLVTAKGSPSPFIDQGSTGPYLFCDEGNTEDLTTIAQAIPAGSISMGSFSAMRVGNIPAPGDAHLSGVGQSLTEAGSALTDKGNLDEPAKPVKKPPSFGAS